jgi:hypothetical protein
LPFFTTRDPERQKNSKLKMQNAKVARGIARRLTAVPEMVCPGSGKKENGARRLDVG